MLGPYFGQLWGDNNTRLKEFWYLVLEHHFSYILPKWENYIYCLYLLSSYSLLKTLWCSLFPHLLTTHISLILLAVASYLLNSKDIFHLSTFLLHLTLFFIHSLLLEFCFLDFHDNIIFWFFFCLMTILFSVCVWVLRHLSMAAVFIFLRIISFIYCCHHFILSLFFHICPISLWVLIPVFSPDLSLQFWQMCKTPLWTSSHQWSMDRSEWLFSFFLHN